MSACDSSDGDSGEPGVRPGLTDRRGSHEDFCTSGPGPGPRGRWFRKSYVEALRNPVPLGPNSVESLMDEAMDTARRCVTRGSGPRAAISALQRPQESYPPTDEVRMAPKRSQSRDKPLRSPFGKGLKAQRESDDSTRVQAVRTGATSLCAAAGSPEKTQGETASVSVTMDSSSPQQPMPSTVSYQLPEPPRPKGPKAPELRMSDQVLGVSSALLRLGMVTLPGTRDCNGRAVVQVCTGDPVWARAHASSAELTRLLVYLHSIPRKEVRDLGLVTLVDARKGPVTPALSQAFKTLQNTDPPVIHTILLLVGRESTFRLDGDAAVRCEVVSSLRALHKFIDSSQLTSEFDGSFPYSHSNWVCLRRKLEAFTASCKHALAFLQNSFCSLNTHRTLRTAQGVTQLISTHKAMMKRVLEDGRAALSWQG